MKTIKLLLYFVLVGTLFFSACKKDEEEDVNEAQVLVEFLESTSSPYGKDYVNTDMPSIIAASEVKTLNETGDVYIIDIRSEADFTNGRIANAVRVDPGDVLDHVANLKNGAEYSKIAVVCRSGQTAGWATSILRLMGYDNVYSMKWGMCSWHEDFAGSWNSNIGNTYASQFTGTVTDKNAQGNLPSLSTGQSEGMDILNSRVATVLAEGFDAAKVSNSEVFGNLNGYYIVNYWPESQYLDPGHIPGATQYTPKETIKYSVDLKTLPTDKPIAVYCYTGQTSAFMAAYLRILGYNAKSLLFGANGMIYDVMDNAGMTVFNDDQIMGYDYVTGK
jgi:rhodanese-related sulfurtransferase